MDRLNSPPALNLAAQILASKGCFRDALEKLNRATNLAADPQTRIRTFNTRARILLDWAAQGGADACQQADVALGVSEELDAGNSYTMLLRAEWYERCHSPDKARKLRSKAENLRRVSP